VSFAWDPDWVVKPGSILREMLDDSGHPGPGGVRLATKLTGLEPAVIEAIIAGAEPITEKIAGRLAVGLQPLAISAQFWLNLEGAYRRGLAAGKVDLDDGP